KFGAVVSGCSFFRHKLPVNARHPLLCLYIHCIYNERRQELAILINVSFRAAAASFVVCPTATCPNALVSRGVEEAEGVVSGIRVQVPALRKCGMAVYKGLIWSRKSPLNRAEVA